MKIAQIYTLRVVGEHSAEDIIFRKGVGDLYQELRDVILSTQVEISDTPRENGKIPPGFNLASSLNKALAASLASLGWQKEHVSPGSRHARSAVDWAKLRPSPLQFGPKEVGLAIEIQFGNHYQFNADVQKLSELILEGNIVAGVSIVPSDELEKYKADRGASFSNCTEKLQRWLSIWTASSALVLPSIIVIGICPDRIIASDKPYFEISAPIYDAQKSTHGVLTPVDRRVFRMEK